MKKILISNATVVNEGVIAQCDVLIENGTIAKIAEAKTLSTEDEDLIDATGLHLLPGLIDDQVHFREPGLTHKGDLFTESRAAVAGGITSFMEMPNTSPPATTLALLEEKYKRASEVSLANYSFFMGTTNHNLDELLAVNPKNVCGVKIFMGSSTGDMLVDDPIALENIFSQVKTLIAVHCEDDPLIKKNGELWKEKLGDDVPVTDHHLIRSEQACYNSSSFAVGLAKKHNTRLHILHISTAKELELFRNDIPMSEKRITAEACVHHLWFSNEDYATKGNFIKWNPAVKTVKDRDAIRAAVNDGRIDVIATDHAPHTLEEKQQSYLKAPSGGPLVQHSLVALLEMYHQGIFSLEKIVEKTAHNVADMFSIESRGFIREGYAADLVLANLHSPWTVSKENIFYKCGWSPFEGQTFRSRIEKTFVNGALVYNNGKVNDAFRGQRLTFNR
ncbi:MAG: dihydroorotase [Flavobacteriales bacterium]